MLLLIPDEFDEVFKNLTALVETAYKTNGNNRVILLTHSMGSTTALYFLNKKVTQAWKDKYIRAMVTLAGPWAGTVRSMKVFAQGTLNDIFAPFTNDETLSCCN